MEDSAVSERASNLVLGISGVVFLFGVIVGFGVLVGSVPGPGADADEIREFLDRSDARVWTGGYIGLLGLLAFLVFAGGLWRLLQEAEGPPAWLSTTAFAAGVANVAASIAGDLVPGAAAFYGGSRVDPATVALLLDAKKFSEMLTVPLMAVFLGCAATVILRRAAMPRWLGWSAAVIAAISLIAVPFGYEASQIPVFLLAFWILAVSVRILVRSARADRPAMAARTP